MANYCEPRSKPGDRVQNIRIRETSIEVDYLGDSPDDSLADCVAEVLPELKKAGIIPLRCDKNSASRPLLEQAQSSVRRAKKSKKSLPILRIVALVGVFVVAYKGLDVLLVASNSDGAQGIVKSMGEWLTMLTPLIRLILGVATSVGVVEVIRRR